MKRGWKLKSIVAPALAATAFAGMASAASMEDLVAAARTEGKLNVIALPRDWCGYGTLIDGFKAKYGLRVVELQPDAGSATQLDSIRIGQGAQAPDVIDVGLSYGPAATQEALSAVQCLDVGQISPTPYPNTKTPQGSGMHSTAVAFGFADIVKSAGDVGALAPRYRGSLPSPHRNRHQGFWGFCSRLSLAKGSVIARPIMV